MERNRYADLLRVLAICLVVLGHWLLVDVTYGHRRLSGVNALNYVSWGRWVTLFFQVMPVFFVVGGYVNALSWARHHGQGESWTVWVRDRVLRLLWPTAVYVAVAELAVVAAGLTNAGRAELAQAGWLVALQLWFLPVYILLIALTPVMLAAHQRWGLAVPAVMAAAAAGVDAGVIGLRLPLLGFANYLLVWGCMHQWGFAWRDGALTRSWWRPWTLAAGGAAALAGLVAWGPFPVDMVGAGERVGNTSPPSVALLAFAAAQTGLLLGLAPAGARLLTRPRWWRQVTRLNTAVMTVYLWHMAPVIVVALALYRTGVMPQLAVGSALWWVLRPAWFAALIAVLIPLTAAVMAAQRPLRRLPPGLGAPGPWSPVLLLAGLAAVVPALTRLAIGGFAPGGHPPLAVLAAYACGLVVILFTGHPATGGAPRAHRAPRPRLTG